MRRELQDQSFHGVSERQAAKRLRSWVKIIDSAPSIGPTYSVRTLGNWRRLPKSPASELPYPSGAQNDGRRLNRGRPLREMAILFLDCDGVRSGGGDEPDYSGTQDCHCDVCVNLQRFKLGPGLVSIHAHQSSSPTNMRFFLVGVANRVSNLILSYRRTGTSDQLLFDLATSMWTPLRS